MAQLASGSDKDVLSGALFPLENDIILRAISLGARHCYELVNAATLVRVGGPFESIAEATYAARNWCREHRVNAWEQRTDLHGGAIGSPIRLFTPDAVYMPLM